MCACEHLLAAGVRQPEWWGCVVTAETLAKSWSKRDQGGAGNGIGPPTRIRAASSVGDGIEGAAQYLAKEWGASSVGTRGPS